MVRRCELQDADRLSAIINHPESQAAAVSSIGLTGHIDTAALIQTCPHWAILIDPDATVAAILQPLTNTAFLGHIYALPQARGRYAARVFREAIQWIWDNTNAVKIIGFTPTVNRQAVRLLPVIGMKIEGKLHNACRHGASQELCDMYVSGICKE